MAEKVNDVVERNMNALLRKLEMTEKRQAEALKATQEQIAAIKALQK